MAESGKRRRYGPRHFGVALLAAAATSLLGLAYLGMREPGRSGALLDDEVGDLLSRNARSAGATGGDGPGGEEPSGLVRWPLDEETTRTLFGALQGKHYVYDPVLHFRNVGRQRYKVSWDEHPAGGWPVWTNSLGMREDGEVLDSRPDLRVLVAGDSHTDGSCANAESFANRLEARLLERRPGEVVEVLNTGTGGYSFYNYLGVIEKYAELSPDVFVVAVYGGNDFTDVLPIHCYFTGRTIPWLPPYIRTVFRKAGGNHTDPLGQVLRQLARLKHSPELEAVCLRAACEVTAEIHRICREKDVDLVMVYIPSLAEVQPQLYEEQIAATRELLRLRPDDVRIVSRMADAWLEFVREEGIPSLDLRTDFSEEDEPLYWFEGLHINLLAHRRIAEALLPLVDP